MRVNIASNACCGGGEEGSAREVHILSGPTLFGRGPVLAESFGLKLRIIRLFSSNISMSWIHSTAQIGTW